MIDPVTFHYLRGNLKLAEILNHPVDHMIGTPLFDLAKDVGGLRDALMQAAKGTPVIGKIIEGESANSPGVLRCWQAECLPVFSSTGAVDLIVASSIETTEQRQHQAALIQDEKFAAVGRLAASITHEINNLLESVTNLLYLPRLSEDVQAIQATSKRRNTSCGVCPLSAIKRCNPPVRDQRRTCFFLRIDREHSFDLPARHRACPGRCRQRLRSHTRMTKFAEASPDEGIAATLSHQSSRSHFRSCCRLSDHCKGSSTPRCAASKAGAFRTPRWGIDSMLANQELAMLKNRGEVGPSLVLKDPYILDFLDLKVWYVERYIKNAFRAATFCNASGKMSSERLDFGSKKS